MAANEQGASVLGETGRIALFLPSLRGGGAERVAVILANGFAARGFSVDMVLAEAIGPFLDELRPQVRLIDFKRKRVAKALPALVLYLRRERPAVMLSFMSHANVIALLARWLSGVHTPVVVSEHSSTSSSTWTARDLRNGAIRMLMKRTYPRAHAVTVVAQAMAGEIAPGLGMDETRLIAIHNPVVNERLMEHAARPPDHPWFEGGMPPVILAVGRLTAAKDFPTLIRAMAELRTRGRPERLIILGEGEERPGLESLIAELELRDCVDLPGFTANPFAFMGHATLFALSSRWEGLPTVLIEAMACGAPVVCTDCPVGPAEILEDGRWGKLVPVGDASTLARAMIETLDSLEQPDVRLRAEDFSEDRAVARYLEVLGFR